MAENFTTENPLDLGLVNRRSRWLNKNKLTVRKFGEAVELDYNTVVRYFNVGRSPIAAHLKQIVAVFKDWPV